MAKIYTKTGDDGTSGLIGGSRARKSDLRFSAIGAVDETNSAIGFACTKAPSEIADILAPIQGDLFELGAELADPKANPRLAAEHSARIERSRSSTSSSSAPANSRFAGKTEYPPAAAG